MFSMLRSYFHSFLLLQNFRPAPVLCIFTFALLFISVESVSKVIVPAVYKEWDSGMPQWMLNKSIQIKYDFTTFLYQKLYPDGPNYIATNRGGEAGVYLRYIVDHYDNFPDVAVFVHAFPEVHQKRWLQMIGCLTPQTTYINFNFLTHTRSFAEFNGFWGGYDQYVEQCWRDVLSIVWDHNKTKVVKELPPTDPVSVTFVCCQQFAISRGMIQKRPLSVWKELLHVIGVQDVCHIGEPEYDNLSWYNLNMQKLGPERPYIVEAGETAEKSGHGRLTQGVTMEHLAHVVYGHLDLHKAEPSEAEICQNFLPRKMCPYSPCMGSSRSNEGTTKRSRKKQKKAKQRLP